MNANQAKRELLQSVNINVDSTWDWFNWLNIILERNVTEELVEKLEELTEKVISHMHWINARYVEHQIDPEKVRDVDEAVVFSDDEIQTHRDAILNISYMFNDCIEKNDKKS